MIFDPALKRSDRRKGAVLCRALCCPNILWEDDGLNAILRKLESPTVPETRAQTASKSSIRQSYSLSSCFLHYDYMRIQEYPHSFCRSDKKTYNSMAGGEGLCSHQHLHQPIQSVYAFFNRSD
jgi:hypothetical protein